MLLLDEPLGALDLKLRQEMQVELKRIQSEVGITFIYVTHDQDEALAMSDRIAVFNLGRIEQVGTPAEIYEHPASAFVAGFVGTSNVISGDLAVQLRGAPDPSRSAPSASRCCLRPRTRPTWTASDAATGTVRDALYLGERTRFVIDVDGGGQLTVVDQNANRGSAADVGSAGRRGAALLGARRRPAAAEPPDRPTDKGEHMRRGRITIVAVAAAAALVLAACGDDSGGGSSADTARGSSARAKASSNLIAWAGYAEDGSTDPAVDWVTPFEEQTGCKTNVKIGNTSDEMVQLMSTGEYDGVSASGDATLRLIAADQVAPVNTDLVPNYADVVPVPEGSSRGTRSTVRCTASRTVGAPTS